MGDARRSRRETLLWATLAAAVFVAAAGLFVVPWFGRPTPGNSDGAFALASLLAAGLVGWASWVLAETAAPDHPVAGGAGAGLVTGLVAHPVAWFLWPLFARTGEPWFALAMPLASMYSLLFVGWVTVPLAMVAGVTTGLARVAVDRWT